MTQANKVLFKSGNLSVEFHKLIDTFVANPGNNQIPANPRYFLRIAKREEIVQGNMLSPDAYLARPPFVFLTIPEAISGLNQRQALLKVGYSANDIHGLGGAPMAAIIFKYPDDVQLANNVEESPSWKRGFFSPTWDNIFQIFENLAGEAHIGENTKSTDGRLTLKSERDKNFICSYPEWGKLRLKGTPYKLIGEEGGSDWYYRTLLQNHLWITERFSGDGKSWCEDASLGSTQEYMGPNVSLQALLSESELAIVEL